MKIRKLDLQSLLYQVNGLSNDHQVAMGIIRALEYDNLEIEGYEQSKWMKFDPNDPKTFPACDSGWFLIAAQKSIEPPTFTMMTELATEGLLEEIRNDIIKFKLDVYWRPLPPPPGKVGK